MRTSTALIFAALSLFSQVSATIYVTDPVASTVCAAGTACTVAWDDDGTTPALGTIGACSIDLCTGGVQTQTCLQNVSPSTDVSQIASVNYTVNPSIGASGNMWFIKFTSLAYKDPTNPTFPFTAFSAKLTLTGMTGTFNATVQAEISGASAAPAAAAATAPAASMTTAKAAVASASASKAATTTAAAKKSGAAQVVGSFTGAATVASLVGLAIGAVMGL